MGQISAEEFKQVPLRVHAFLSDVPLRDVWAIDLQRARPGITLDEFLRAASTISARGCGPSLPVRALLKIRFFIGGLLGLDREPETTVGISFAARLKEVDRTESLLAPGTPEGFFRVVYRFRNEQLLEVRNRTAHAAALSALVETSEGYRFYFGVYVRRVSWVTPLYMGLIDPFRKWLVYPSLLRSIEAKWETTFRNT